MRMITSKYKRRGVNIKIKIEYFLSLTLKMIIIVI